MIRTDKVCIVGLGYVGLPLALLAANKGNKVIGFDINKEKISLLQQEISPLKDIVIEKDIERTKGKINFTYDPGLIKEAQIVIICVQTPVSKQNKPDLTALKSAIETVSVNMLKNQLVVIESTIFPGTIEDIILPIMESGGGKVGIDFFLAHCPERIDPGNIKHTLVNIPRVVAGVTSMCTEKAQKFYSKLINAPIIPLNSIKAVETTKIVENTFRDVNIALMNELARSFDTMEIDILEVIKGASTKPFAFMPHFPGCGVGGHCIPVDPYYLIERSKQNGFHPRFLTLAREINESMPTYTLQRITAALIESGRGFMNSKITVLGISYKREIDDFRESPAIKIIDLLKKEGANVDIYDPYVSKHSTVNSLSEALNNKDCVVIATNHSLFQNITAQQLRDHNVKAVVDGRNCLNKEKILQMGIIYKGIGR